MSNSIYTGKIGLGATQKIDAPIKAAKGKGDVKPKKTTGRDIRTGK